MKEGREPTEGSEPTLVPCSVCGEPHVPSPNYLERKSKCRNCRPASRHIYGTWDRWANGNQYGSYNSDDD